MRILALTGVAFVVLLLSLGCAPGNKSAKTSEEGESSFDIGVDLDKPVPEKQEEKKYPSVELGSGTGEELWLAKCSQCHEPERGLNKFKGQQWKPIITRMMKKPGAYLNSATARKIYFYLYEKTTGEKSPEELEAEEESVSSAGMVHFGE